MFFCQNAERSELGSEKFIQIKTKHREVWEAIKFHNKDVGAALHFKEITETLGIFKNYVTIIELGFNLKSMCNEQGRPRKENWLEG